MDGALDGPRTMDTQPPWRPPLPNPSGPISSCLALPSLPTHLKFGHLPSFKWGIANPKSIFSPDTTVATRLLPIPTLTFRTPYRPLQPDRRDQDLTTPVHYKG